MPIPPNNEDVLRQAVELREAYPSSEAAARAGGIHVNTLKGRLRQAAKKGLMGTKPILPGFHIAKTTAVTDADGKLLREFVQQKPEPGEPFEVPDGFGISRISAYTDGDGNLIGQWTQVKPEDQVRLSAMRAVIDELKQEIVPTKPVKGPEHTNELLLNQYTVTDLHFGMLAWAEETRGSDYDLKIAERLLIDWFSAAIAMSPDAKVAVLAQLGDFLHHDSLESVTPAHKHVLDADSRLQKIIRVVIRVIRQVIAMLLQRHAHVHVIMASGNHDPASGAWLREWLHTLYENEPRITIDNSPDLYYAYEWGQTALFYHHGDKRSVVNVDAVFAGKFRDIFGRCPKSYGHVGHRHSDEVRESNLMKVERHRTLAPADAHSSRGGWLSGRDAKVVTYHREFGEVSRIILSPEMVTRREAV